MRHLSFVLIPPSSTDMRRAGDVLPYEPLGLDEVPTVILKELEDLPGVVLRLPHSIIQVLLHLPREY